MNGNYLRCLETIKAPTRGGSQYCRHSDKSIHDNYRKMLLNPKQGDVLQHLNGNTI